MKKLKKLMLPIIIIVVLLGGTFTAARLGLIFIPGLSKEKTAESPRPEKEEIGPIVKLSPMVINLKDGGGRSYLKTTIVLEVGKKNHVEEVNKAVSLLNDLVIMNLGDKSLEDLRPPGSKENLKQELLGKMNQHFPPGTIKRVYFDEFLFE